MGFADDVTLSAVSAGAAVLTATISGGALKAVSMSSDGATDAADMCMNSKYPPTVMMETPANAITPEASLWILVKTACCLDACSCSTYARLSRWS